MSNKKIKVFVGLSGGVDSSVSAALLKEAGYDVTGVFIKVWQPDFLPCTWREERRDAMRVAAKLGIPFLTFDLEKEYKKDVVDYMIREYKVGRTPNPDVMCNKYVKFGAFFRKARSMGADFVATGHYARVVTNNQCPYGTSPEGRQPMSLRNISRRETTNVPTEHLTKGDNLLTAADADKDQSYFLWTLNQEILSKTFFPIGDYKKSEVRALAKKFGLFTSEKKDSQGLCFVGKLDMKEFLSNYIKPKRGNVLDENGEVIGFHKGVWFFTLGERHGFTITRKSSNDIPLFVLSKDIKKNTITVGPKRAINQNLTKTQIILSETNWIIGKPPIIGKKYGVRPRYRAEFIPCFIEKIRPKKSVISLVDKDLFIAPGQSMVLYNGNVCLGGGIIDNH